MLELAFTRLAGRPELDLLVIGPSLGTAVTPLWQCAADLLADRFEVVGWDLPGHGRSAPARAPFSIAEAAESVATRAAALAEGRRAFYAGISFGGAVGFELALVENPFSGIGAIASAPKIGQEQAWLDRAALVRRAGTPVMVSGSAQRWFAPGFVDRAPAAVSALLLSLSDADDESYALACEALAAYDVCGAIAHVATPITLVAGEHDTVVTPRQAAEVTAGTPVRVLTMTGVAHLPSAEDPAATAATLTDLFDLSRLFDADQESR